MNCPKCGYKASLITPDYGYGYGAEFACYNCDPYGRRWADKSPEARAESDSSRAQSRANAEEYRRGQS